MVHEPDNRREFFRLRYPHDDVPWVAFDDNQRYPMIELSIRGIRLLSSRRFSHRQRVAGTIFLEGGQTIEFSGVATRRNWEEIVIVDVDGITQAHVNREQLRLMKKYAI